jgi:hypothetical protein
VEKDDRGHERILIVRPADLSHDRHHQRMT